ncbi:hypothetical protein DMUE_4522 [Dictyocoela muelleri]|nr:hypothetical protein DMUE_4522 [Dictyocoela muelleri]
MKKKNLDSYRYIFLHIKNIIGDFNGHIITDFESALVHSIKTVFTNSKLAGCNFHFSQIIWRRVHKNNLVIKYKSDENFRKLIRYLILLSYVPICKVEKELEKFKRKYNTKEEYIQIIGFFERNFINNQTEISKFISFWSVYDRVSNKLPTTTNSLEA